MTEAPGPLTTDERIARLFHDKLNLDVPSAATDLFETAALDSMMFVELLAELENEFGVTVSLEEIDIDTFRSIERIATFVRERTAVPAAGAPEGGRC
jgi:acyl carrier protein